MELSKSNGDFADRISNLKQLVGLDDGSKMYLSSMYICLCLKPPPESISLTTFHSPLKSTGTCQKVSLLLFPDCKRQMIWIVWLNMN